MKNRSGAVLVLCACGALALGTGFLSHAARRQDDLISTLQKEKTELDALRAENEKWKTVRVDAAETSRLRQENSELPKLRNQVWQLREPMKAQDSTEPEVIRQLRSENDELRQRKRELRELPNRAACIKNLKLIDAAKKQCTQQNGLQTGEPITTDVLAPLLPNGFPSCPDGGHYSVNRVGSPPACSISGHSIP
jgi:hypothetical protein